MRIFITGAAGFIGSHLYDFFEKEGHEVRGIDNFSHASKYPHKAIYGDIRYISDLESHIQWCDIVYHLAAQIHVDKSITNPQETVDVNVNGTLNILELCRKYGKKLVFASSSEVYGTAQSESISETHQLDSQSPYAASKVAGDRLCKSYIDTYDMDICIVRNFNTFGEYQNDGSYGGVIAIFTKRALRGETLTIFGTGKQERDYMYIDDALQAYSLAKDLKGVYNFGTGKTVNIADLAKMIVSFTESPSKIENSEPRAGEVMRLCADISKAKSIGFEPAVDFESGLLRYLNWCEKI